MHIYGIIYKENDPASYWVFQFSSKDVFAETAKHLHEIRKGKVSTYKYEWKWDKWTLESVNKEKVAHCTLHTCESPTDVVNYIEKLHAFWDDYIESC